MGQLEPKANREVETIIDRLRVLFVENVDAVFNVAYRIVWNRADAEDVVQSAFVKAAGALDQLRDQSRVRAWLLQIAYREAIGVLRRRRDIPTDPLDLPDGAADQRGPEDLVIAREAQRMVVDALRRMGPEERLAVVLRDVEELPMAEVADVMDTSLSAAKMRVHRGRASLRALLTKELVNEV